MTRPFSYIVVVRMNHGAPHRFTYSTTNPRPTSQKIREVVKSAIHNIDFADIKEIAWYRAGIAVIDDS